MRAGGGFKSAVAGGILLLGTGCAFGQQDSDVCVMGLATEQSGAEHGINVTTLGTTSSISAQSFKLDANLTLSSVQVRLKAKAPTGSSLSGTVVLSVYPDNQNNISGVPSEPGATAITGTTSNILSAGINSSESAWYTFAFTQAVTLTANLNYWIVLSASYPIADPSDPTAAFILWMGNSQNAFGAGTAKYKGAGAWTQASPFTTNPDFLFRVGC
jgi:hypothetical protein